MKRYSDYKINCPDTGTGDFLTLCPECSHTRKPRNQKKKCLSVNLDKAVWMCFNCGWKGHLEFTDEEKQEYAKLHTPVKQQYKPLEDKEKNINGLSDGIIKWFKSRGISEETLKLHKIGSAQRYIADSNQNVIAFPFYRNGEIVNVKYRAKDKNFS